MGSAYFITLDNLNPGFDPFVNGKSIARHAEALGKFASSIGLKTPDEYVSISPQQAARMAADFGVDLPLTLPPEQWFDAEEGLIWTQQIRSYLKSNPSAMRDSESILEDLAEYDVVFLRAKSIDAKWHLSVDF